MDRAALGFTFEGKRIAPEMYGDDYVSEFEHILKTYAAKATNILEWGAGLTTQILMQHGAALPGFSRLLTMDNNQQYLRAVFGSKPPNFAVGVAVDLIGLRTRGQDDQSLNYTTYPLSTGRRFDFILIDGRRRLECAFIAAMLSHASTTIVLHDFRRVRYQPITALFEEVEAGNQFRVLKPRADVLAALAPSVPGIMKIMSDARARIPNR